MSLVEANHLMNSNTLVPTHLEYPNLTLGDLLTRSARLYATQPAIIYKEQSYTFPQTNHLAELVCAGLLKKGYKQGDKIGIILPNIPQFVFAFFGILKMGGIVVAINPTYTQREIIRMLNSAEVSACFILDQHLELTSEIGRATSVKEFIVTTAGEKCNPSEQKLDGGAGETQNGINHITKFNYLLGVEESSKEDYALSISPDDPAIFQFSGGTTGLPKAAVGLHRNVVANVYQFQAWLGPAKTGNEAILVAIPLFHVYGMVLGMVLAIQTGSPMVLIKSPGDIREIFQAIRDHKPAVFPGAPSLYYALLHHPFLENYRDDLKCLKVCISGSAPLNPSVKASFEQLISGPLVEGYGLSESPTATHCNPLVGVNKTGSIGLALPDVECRLVSIEDGIHNVLEGHQGELLIRGPQVMKEYYNQPEETENALQNGWLHTGDIAWKDTDGYYFIRGRKKELIKVGGLQVWPQEVEEVIAQMPGVLEVSAAGVPDGYLGEVVYAWVVRSPEVQLISADVIRFCRDKIARHKVPAEVRFVEALPRSTVGKVLRRELVSSVIKDKD